MNIKDYLKEINIKFNDNFYEKCEQYVKLLQEWGKVHNLSAQLDDDQIYENILDSIYPLTFIETNINSAADVGTGAGYPGLILAMALSDIKFYLIEPRIKRASFLNYAKAVLKLDNVNVICSRVENISDDLEIDLITSRAVNSTSTLFKITENIKANNTAYLLYKGSMLAEEIQEANLKNYNIISRNNRNYLYKKD